MKVVKVLVCEGADGSFPCVANDKIAMLEEKARAARESGIFDGQPITGGVLLDMSAFSPVLQFRCDPGSGQTIRRGRKAKE